MPPHVHRLPSSRITAFIHPERVEAALRPLVPDEDERAFVLRCLFEEGPAHHRGANFALLALLVDLLDALGATLSAVEPATVPMRLPPHLDAHRAEPASWPVPLDLAPLRRVLRDDAEVRAAADCLTDGPPQHVVANLVMLHLIGAARAAAAARRA